MGVGCDCRGSCTCLGVYLIWLCGCGVSNLRHLRIMAGVHTSTSHSGEAMTSGLRSPTGRRGVACGVRGTRQGVGGFSSSGGGGGSSSSPHTDISPSNSSRSSSSSSCLGVTDILPKSNGDFLLPRSASWSAFSLPRIPMCDGACIHLISVPWRSVSSKICAHRSAWATSP